MHIQVDRYDDRHIRCTMLKYRKDPNACIHSDIHAHAEIYEHAQKAAGKQTLAA